MDTDVRESQVVSCNRSVDQVMLHCGIMLRYRLLPLVKPSHPDSDARPARPFRSCPLTDRSHTRITSVTTILFPVIIFVLSAQNAQPQGPHLENTGTPLRKYIRIPDPVRRPFALRAATRTVQTRSVRRIEPVLIRLCDGLHDGGDKHLARAVVGDVLFKFRTKKRRLVLDVLPDLGRAWCCFRRRHFHDGFAVLRFDGLGDARDELASEVVDGLAENGVDLGFGVEHILYNLWDEQADELTGIKEVAAGAQLPEGVCDA